MTQELTSSPLTRPKLTYREDFFFYADKQRIELCLKQFNNYPLSTAFLFSTTPQGHKFWADVAYTDFCSLPTSHIEALEDMLLAFTFRNYQEALP